MPLSIVQQSEATVSNPVIEEPAVKQEETSNVLPHITGMTPSPT